VEPLEPYVVKLSSQTPAGSLLDSFLANKRQASAIHNQTLCFSTDSCSVITVVCDRLFTTVCDCCSFVLQKVSIDLLVLPSV